MYMIGHLHVQLSHNLTMNFCIVNLHCTCHVCITISLIHAQLTPNFMVNSCMLNFHHNSYICRKDETSMGP
jgi:hypothetical protein